MHDDGEDCVEVAGVEGHGATIDEAADVSDKRPTKDGVYSHVVSQGNM